MSADRQLKCRKWPRASGARVTRTVLSTTLGPPELMAAVLDCAVGSSRDDGVTHVAPRAVHRRVALRVTRPPVWRHRKAGAHDALAADAANKAGRVPAGAVGRRNGGCRPGLPQWLRAAGTQASARLDSLLAAVCAALLLVRERPRKRSVVARVLLCYTSLRGGSFGSAERQRLCQLLLFQGQQRGAVVRQLPRARLRRAVAHCRGTV